MKNSKVLKMICYITIPILFLAFYISIFYQMGKDNYSNIAEDNYKEYFESDNFLSTYMHILSDAADNLIYRNKEYNSVEDEEYRICYANYEIDYGNNIKDNYFLLLYKNLAFTNVELTTNTNSIEKIKAYIDGCDGKHTKIINGNIESDSEIVSTKGLQYFENFKNTYYKTVENGEAISATEYVELVEESDVGTISTYDSPKNVKYFSVSIQDYEIYSTYKEELIRNRNDQLLLRKIISDLAPTENFTLIAIPVSSVLLLIMFIYLIISIGHTKNKEGIDLNDFDKVPLEIITFIFFIILGIIIALIDETLYSYRSEEILMYYNLLISALITLYLVSYIVCMAMFVTLVKRIKAKQFLSTCFCGRILKFIIRITKKCLEKIKNTSKNILENLNIDLKILLCFMGISLTMFLILALFNVFGVFVDICIVIYLLYKLIERANCFESIKKHLKNMYEGKEIDNLKTSDFTPEFKDIVLSINDISNGFENAKQEGIKSERMKTELITNVSHDIKTPLTSIINYVDLLKKEEINNEKAKEYIDVLDNKSQRLKKLTEDLVEASKASSGNVKLNIEKIDIVELIKQTTGEFEDTFKEKKLDIISSMPKETIYINADNRYMYRIIENLFSNISKYALNSSRVYIDVNKTGMKVKISIKNISADRLNISSEELMQRFVRGDKSRTTEGSGLGLSISRSLTELQKGTFELQIDGDLFKVELEFDIAK